MKAMSWLICVVFLIGCQSPPVTVYIPPAANVVRAPDLSGVLPLLTERTIIVRALFKDSTADQRLPASATVVARKDGWWYAITCDHCVMGTPRFFAAAVTRWKTKIDGYPAQYVASDTDIDLCLMRFQSPKSYRIYALGEPRVGDIVFAVGWPEHILWGRRARQRLNVQRGWVNIVEGPTVGHNAGSRNGFSGGAILNATGELLGISQSLAAGIHSPGHFSYGVHSREVAKIMQHIPE